VPFTKQWFRYCLGWFWLHQQVAALEEFQVKIGDSTKVYPFLTQMNALSFVPTETYLQVGKSTNILRAKRAGEGVYRKL
jgi:hypothetical protein